MLYLLNRLLKLEILGLVLAANLFVGIGAASALPTTAGKQSPPPDIIRDPNIEPEEVIPETWRQRREERYQAEQQRREERYQMEAEERQQELWNRQQESWNDYQQEQRDRTQQRLDAWEEQRQEQLRRY